MVAKITIDMDNAAFGEGRAANEVARILSSITFDLRAGKVECDEGGYKALMDINGNKVGEFNVESEPITQKGKSKYG